MEIDKKLQEDIDVIVGLIRAIVKRPEELLVEHTSDDRGNLLTVTSHPSDVGFLLGKEGKTINAIRTLIRCIGAKHKQSFAVKIFDPRNQEVI